MRTLLPAGRGRERRRGVRDGESGSAAAVLPAGASRAGSRGGSCLPARDEPAEAGPGQSSAGCQSTGGGSEPCLMMLAYTLSSAWLSGPTRPAGSPPKNRRRTRFYVPGRRLLLGLPPLGGQGHLGDPPVGGGQAARHQAPGGHPPHVVGHPAALPADLRGKHGDLHPPPVGHAQRRQHVVIGQRHAAVGEELAVHLVRQAQLHPNVGQPRPLLVPVEPSAGGAGPALPLGDISLEFTTRGVTPGC